MGLGHGDPAAHRTKVGVLGELVAQRFLAERGAIVLGRNVRVGRGEVDLHLRLRGEVLAVEVKTIAGPDPALDPVDNFTPAKAAQVRRLARQLSPPAYRVDFIGVLLQPEGVEVRWIPHAA